LHELSLESNGFNSQLPIGKLKLYWTEEKTVKEGHGFKKLLITKKRKKKKKRKKMVIFL
jgi:hypothetical protein